MKINFNVKATNMDLTEALSDYLDKKLSKLDVFMGDDTSAQGQVEIGLTTTSQNSGEIYRAEINLHTSGQSFRAEAEESDLYAAIDKVQNDMLRQVKSHKNKQRSLTRKGAAQFKKLLTRFRSK